MARFLVIIAAYLVAGTSALATHPAWMENLHNQENERRALHGVNPLTMNDELNSMAQGWADKLAQDCQGMSPSSHASEEARHWNGQLSGENIHMLKLTGGDFDTLTSYAMDHAQEAGDNWYKEINYYPWPEYTGSEDLGGQQIFHFTQQVWKGSEQVGYALGLNPECNRYYVVARYWPTGNVIPRFADNVLPK